MAPTYRLTRHWQGCKCAAFHGLADSLIHQNGGKFMTKAEIIENMANDAGLTKAEAQTCLESFLAGVTQALKKKDGKVTLVGFGTFQKSRRKARKGRNPQTGEEIKIKAGNVVKFKASPKLKAAI
jgi:DNA-binding protein HU-beta